jgi:hypothetical protein
VLGVAMRMTLTAPPSPPWRGSPRRARPISQITLLGSPPRRYSGRSATAARWLAVPLAYAVLRDAAPHSRSRPAARPAVSAAARGCCGDRTGLPMPSSSPPPGVGHVGTDRHLAGLGMGATLAVWVSALRGIGQSAARLAEVLFGGRLPVLTLTVLATALLPVGFAAGSLGGEFAAAAVAFAVVYGAGNGLATIVRGALPLVLFDPARYGALSGRLVAPSFLAAAAAPVVYAAVIERWGSAVALHLSATLATLVVAAAVAAPAGGGELIPSPWSATDAPTPDRPDRRCVLRLLVSLRCTPRSG